MKGLKFSGHETFICKQLWLKKGYDFLQKGYNFNDPDAVVKLGVGKNMVSSIRFWLKAMNLIDGDNKNTKIAQLILDDEGYDPFIEDIGTIWLLHYLLVTTNYASLYQIIFNDFLKGKREFSKDTLQNYIKRLSTNKNGSQYNGKTVQNDIKVFVRNYLQSENELKDFNIEDDHAGLFQELGLIKQLNQLGPDNKVIKYYIIEREERTAIPKEIFLYSILANKEITDSVSLNELVSGNNSVGSVFLMNRSGVYQKIEELLHEYSYISFNQTAGVPVLQFDKKPDPIEVLKNYYENANIHALN